MQKQLIREARWAIGLSLVYLACWIFFGYFFPVKAGILGFPIWFELSCLFLPLVFTLAVYVVIKTVYQEINLEAEQDDQ